MKKEDFIEKYPDVKVQIITPPQGLGRTQTEDRITKMCECLDLGLLGYTKVDCDIHVFTSDLMEAQLLEMTQGIEVVDDNGFHYTITSESAFICGGEMCIRAKNEYSTDAYACKSFNLLNK